MTCTRLLTLIAGCGVVSGCHDQGPGGGGDDTAPPDGSIPPAAADTLGVISALNNYVVLRLADGTERRFHWGGAPAGGVSSRFKGDFDGDGYDEIGLFSPRARRFYLARTAGSGAPIDELEFAPVSAPVGEPCTLGEAGLIGIAGDFAGDGVDTVGIYDPTASTFYLREPDGTARTITFGPRCGTPLTGDFAADGQHRDGIGVFDAASSTFHLLPAVDGSAAEASFVFGPAVGAAVVGDWDHDGVDTVGILGAARPRAFYARQANAAGPADLTIRFDDPVADAWINNAPVLPIAGRWRGDGAAEPAPFAWPTGDDPQDPCLDPARLEAIAAAGAARPHLYSVLVACHGRLVVEQYYRGFDAAIANNIKSVSKSVLSAIYGVSLAAGYFGYAGGSMLDHLGSQHLDEALGYDPVSDTGGYGRLGQMVGTQFRRVSLYNMITMTGGFAWNENTPTPPNLGGMSASTDWTGYVVGSEMSQTSPVGSWNYSTGLTTAAARVLTREARARTGYSTLQLDRYAETTLFDRLGIAAMRWDFEPDQRDGQRGPNTGGWELWMRPRDLARFGQVYLQGGQVDGAPVVPAAWVAATTQGIFAATGACGLNVRYGGWWWRSTFTDRVNHVAYDGFHALGYGGQHIIVIPSLDLVIVMTSSTAGNSCTHLTPNFDLVMDEILPAVRR